MKIIYTEPMTRTLKTVKLFSVILILFITRNVSGQDILTLKSGREIKALIVEESSATIKYREYGIDNSPLYTIDRTKVESVRYGRKQSEPPERKTVRKDEIAVVNEEAAAQQPLVVTNRFVMQNGKTLSTRQVKTVMEDFPEALDLYSKGHRQLNISKACPAIVVGVCFIAGMSSNKMEEGQKMKVLATGLGISAGLMVTGIVFSVKGKKTLRRAVDIYNAESMKPKAYDLDIRISATGIGVAMKF